MNPIEIVQLIRTDLTKRGKGTEDDPCRVIRQYWSMDGELVFEIDPCEGEKES